MLQDKLLKCTLLEIVIRILSNQRWKITFKQQTARDQPFTQLSLQNI